MIFKLFLTFVSLAFSVIGFSQLSRVAVVAYLLIIGGFFGAFFAWFPDWLTYFANLLGVGRGVDLVFYVWIMVSCAIFFSLYLNSRRQMEAITRLSRHIAITNALTNKNQH